MKRLLFLLLCVLLIQGLPLFGGENILVNGDFETGTIDGWGPRFGIGNVEATTDNPHSGDYCGRDYNRTATWHGIWQSQNMRDVTQLGEVYTVQIWIRTDQETPVNIAVTMQYEPSSGTVYNQIASAAIGTEWTLIETEYTMLDNDSTTATFYIEAPGSSTCEIYVDDAYMGIGPPDPDTPRGAATDPVPEDGNEIVDSETTTALLWTGGVDPNIVSITGYDVYFGAEPNMSENSVYSVTTETLSGLSLAFDTTYYWRVDSYVVWDSNDISGVLNDLIEGDVWSFTTLPDDKTPIVTAGTDVLTSIELLPAGLTGSVDDYGEGDISSVAWEVLGTAAANEAKQMITRGQTLSAVTTDPNLLMDWIGTDTRQVGNPLYLSLKGLPAGTYNWLSYHHDAENQNGIFDVTVHDASGTTVTTDIQCSQGNALPVTTVPLTITSNGTDDVVLVFDLQDATQVTLQFFLMNGFELTDGVSVDPLYIDFGTVVSASDTTAVNVMSGYEAYKAQHEVTASFTEQSYSAFGTTVSILPTWGGVEASVTDTTNDPTSASQSAMLETEWPGEYLVQLSATDAAMQTDSDTMIVTVAADTCAAAQLSTSWPGFSDYDLNEDCQVNIDDLTIFADGWLDDRNLTGQE